jgi:hypothetical protein
MTRTSVDSCFPMPAYNPEKFVGRQAELELIHDKAKALLRGEATRERVVIFVGGRGVGKSWLLSHLKSCLCALDKRCMALWLDLAQYAGTVPISALSAILNKLQADVGNVGASAASNLSEQAHEFEGQMRDHTNGMVGLLIDHVYESDRELLKGLERYLLRPLSVIPNVLIVMTGRGPAYSFQTPELRMKARFWDLESFPPNLTLQQLARQARIPPEELRSKCDEIYEQSGGNPLANYLLANWDDPAKALSYVVDGMLEAVRAEERDQVRDDIEALCVLRAFDEYRTPTLVKAYYTGSDTECSKDRAGAIRARLLDYALASYEAKYGGYCLDPPTRRLTERYLWIAKKESWLRQHHAALRLYEDWADKYPRSRDSWKAEARYHREVLKSGKPADPEDSSREDGGRDDADEA